MLRWPPTNNRHEMARTWDDSELNAERGLMFRLREVVLCVVKELRADFVDVFRQITVKRLPTEHWHVRPLQINDSPGRQRISIARCHHEVRLVRVPLPDGQSWFSPIR